MFTGKTRFDLTFKDKNYYPCKQTTSSNERKTVQRQAKIFCKRYGENFRSYAEQCGFGYLIVAMKSIFFTKILY